MSWKSMLGLILLTAVAGESQAAELPRLEHRWIYLSTNMLVEENVEKDLALLQQAAEAGYTGVVLTDSKFIRWDGLPERYVHNVGRVRRVCRELNLDCIAAVCPIGYSSGLLSRDPNLAAGLPVVDAPFLARDGRLVPADASAKLSNGGFEKHEKHIPSGWRFVDRPGEITFIDTDVKYEGNCSLRMQDIGKYDPQHGHGRACQTLSVKPFRYYHVSVAVKTENFDAASDVRIAVLAPGGVSLNYYEPRVARTQDWRRVDITFNSLEFADVSLYLGVWGGRRGRIWWDDVRIEPGGLVNVVRREGAPLRVVSEDSKTVYVEGKDFDNALDPKLGVVRYPGQFTAWHEPPLPTLPPGSRISQRQTVLLSYYHTALIHHDQVMCCMAEPKVYDILRWQVEQVHKHVQPHGYFLQHDEIRVQGWDQSCVKTGKTPGWLLAENVKKCVRIVREQDPGTPIYVWSDMFDPFHNARKTGRYYLVKGDGPWFGSWEGLDKDVIIVNWNSRKGPRAGSLKHFADRGHKQILAGYYDRPVDAIRGWLDDARQVPGVVGVMYTTWRHEYDDLEPFARVLKQYPR